MNNLNVLILEDELAIRERLVESIEVLGWNVFASDSIENSLEAINAFNIDLMVLDRMIFNKDSLMYLDEFKRKNSNIRILILSTIDSSYEKANAIDLGADDYLAKPFDTHELIARLKSIARRTEPQVELILKFEDLVLDLVSHACYFNNRNANLSQKEFLLLHVFVKKPGKIFNKEDLLKSVWDASSEMKTNVVESTINSLRRKLELIGSIVQIKNTRYVGYWIEA